MKGQVVHLRAASETEALARVYAEYGKEAVIGEIRLVRMPGFAGLIGRKEIEVSVRVKPQVNDGDADKFRTLVNRIGQSIRSEQGDEYFRQWESALDKFNIGGSLAGELLAMARDKPCNPETLAQTIATAVPVRKQLPRLMALVGATGAGKTTTAAKLAGLYSRNLGKRVAIITLDTSRIGAVEQLRIYTRIMGIPLSVVSSPGELKETMEKYRNFDHVYIDTTGRPPGNLLAVAELQTIMDECAGIETALVVSATTKLDDLIAVNKGYSRLSPTCLIVTKVDETCSLGSTVTFIHQSGLPLACIGTGQGVPHDIQFADTHIVAEWISSGSNPYSGSGGGSKYWLAD